MERAYKALELILGVTGNRNLAVSFASQVKDIIVCLTGEDMSLPNVLVGLNYCMTCIPRSLAAFEPLEVWGKGRSRMASWMS